MACSGADRSRDSGGVRRHGLGNVRLCGRAQGPAENNAPGKGLFRYVNNGARYMYGQFPKGKVPWFDRTNTQTVFAALPDADKPPEYPYACYYLCNSPGL